MEERDRGRLGTGIAIASTLVAAGGAVIFDKDLFGLVCAAGASVALIWGRWPSIQRWQAAKRARREARHGVIEAEPKTDDQGAVVGFTPSVFVEQDADARYVRVVNDGSQRVQDVSVFVVRLELWSEEKGFYREAGLEKYLFWKLENLDPGRRLPGDTNIRQLAIGAGSSSGFLLHNAPRHVRAEGVWRVGFEIKATGQHPTPQELCFEWKDRKALSVPDPSTPARDR